MDKTQADRRARLLVALDHLQSALEQLDAADAPAHVGAHVDLAIHQLDDAIKLDHHVRRSDCD